MRCEEQSVVNTLYILFSCFVLMKLKRKKNDPIDREMERVREILEKKNNENKTKTKKKPTEDERINTRSLIKTPDYASSASAYNQ